MSMEEELHSGLGTLGVEVSHKPKWVSIGGHPVLYKNRDPGKLPDFGFIEIQRCEYCERTREVTNKDMSMENPSWVDGQKSILEQRSMSMEEEKDASWEECEHRKTIQGNQAIITKWECATCGYIGTKTTLREHIIGANMKHEMKPSSEEKDTSWEARFEEKFVNISDAPCLSCWHHHMNETPHECACHGKVTRHFTPKEEEIKSFIRQEREALLREIVEEAEKMRRDRGDENRIDCKFCGLDDYECECRTYNKALTEVQELIKKKI